MTRNKLLGKIFFVKRNLSFWIEHFLRNLKFYPFFRVILLQISFGSGGVRIRNDFFRLHIRIKILLKVLDPYPDPDPQHWFRHPKVRILTINAWPWYSTLAKERTQVGLLSQIRYREGWMRDEWYSTLAKERTQVGLLSQISCRMITTVMRTALPAEMM